METRKKIFSLLYVDKQKKERKIRKEKNNEEICNIKVDKIILPCVTDFSNY